MSRFPVMLGFLRSLIDKMSSPANRVPPLTFEILAECNVSRARTSLMTLPHYTVDTPVFMPVGTKGTLKGLLPDQLEAMDCQIILGNTYHLGTKPGPELLKKAGGLHKFIGWNRALLTDSGGFQMVSLYDLAKIDEQGVLFKSPYDETLIKLTPEESIKIQNAIGADIIMQLDDVVSVLTVGPRVEEAMNSSNSSRFTEIGYKPSPLLSRSSVEAPSAYWMISSIKTARWLDRCISAHERPEYQNIFPVVQGGLDANLRKECVKQLTQRPVNGFAIGGLSGGEDKEEFWRIVHLCTGLLPKEKPRYCMGVGFAADLVVCVALGVDMFDCVFPTRTARFGCGLVDTGQINLKHKKYCNDYRPIQEDCECTTCRRYTRAYLHTIVTLETVACHLLSVHNVYYQMKLMRKMRESIKNQKFPEFVQDFMAKMFAGRDIPTWIKHALQAVNISV